MSIDVKRIAELSKLSVDDSELSSLQKDMQDIIDMVSDLPLADEDILRLNTENSTLRCDELTCDNSSGDIISQMPYIKDNMFFVPKVVD